MEFVENLFNKQILLISDGDWQEFLPSTADYGRFDLQCYLLSCAII
jgi:hypothetical protein